MRAVIFSGGLTHDFAATSACLADLLAEQGLATETYTDLDTCSRVLPGAAVFVVNALRWTMTAAGTPERYRQQAAAEGLSPSPAARAALAAHLRTGGGLLAMHTAVICFDDWPEWAAALGARWVWGQSNHPPLGPDVQVRVSPGHPLTEGVPGFILVDEVYSDLELHPGLTALLSAVPPGRTDAQPLLLAREHQGGRVVYDALGHHPPSYEVPAHREILRRAIRWTTTS